MRRRDAVIRALELQFGKVSAKGAEGGTHILWTIPEVARSARDLKREARALGIGLHPLDDSAVLFAQAQPASERGIVLGYTHLAEAQIEDGIAKIAAAARGSRD